MTCLPVGLEIIGWTIVREAMAASAQGLVMVDEALISRFGSWVLAHFEL